MHSNAEVAPHDFEHTFAECSSAEQRCSIKVPVTALNPAHMAGFFRLVKSVQHCKFARGGNFERYPRFATTPTAATP